MIEHRRSVDKMAASMQQVETVRRSISTSRGQEENDCYNDSYEVNELLLKAMVVSTLFAHYDTLNSVQVTKRCGCSSLGNTEARRTASTPQLTTVK